MVEKKIKLANLKDAQKFVDAAQKCDFDIDISYNHMVVDAKSIVEVCSMGFAKGLTVKFDGSDECLNHILREYAVL